MGAFNINITGVGGHGCERQAKPGDKLHRRCGRFTCPDCLAYDFTQRLRQAGMVTDGHQATGQEVKHSPACPVVDDHGIDHCTCGAVPVGAEVYKSVDGKQYWRKWQQALFTHWPDSPDAVVDDMLKNERRSGSF
jgi:hypothetical protein